MISVKPALIWTALTLGALLVTTFWFIFWAAGMANTPRISAGAWFAAYFPLGVSLVFSAVTIRLWLVWAQQP